MITKYLVLAAIIAAVWYGFNAISRRNAAKTASDQRDRKGPVEQMSACAFCGMFVTSEQRDCGRDSCPY